MSDDLAEVSVTKPNNGLSEEQLKESRALLNNYMGVPKTRIQETKPEIPRPNLTIVKSDKKKAA